MTRAAPLRSDSDNPISVITMIAYCRRWRAVAPVPAPDLSISFGSAREMRTAGINPMISTQVSVATTATTNNRQLTCGSIR